MDAMINSIHIKRFKSIRELTLDFGQVNLFIGANGSGKSNILEAIGIASSCFSRGLSDSDIGSKGMRLTPPELMKSSFKGDSLPKTFEIRVELEKGIRYRAVLTSKPTDPLLRFFSESAEANGKKLFGRSYRGASATGVSHADRLDPNRGIWDQIKATYDMPEDVANALMTFSRYCIYTPQTDFLRGRQSGRIDSPPVGLRGEGLSTAVAGILNAWGSAKKKSKLNDEASKEAFEIIDAALRLVWLPGWTNRFGTEALKAHLLSNDVAEKGGPSVYFKDRFMHSDRNKLSAYDSSEGTLFLLFAAIILTHPHSPRVLALDNVDNSLNPRITRALVECIINLTKRVADSDSEIGARQVFLTSHNPTSLDAFDIFDDHARVFVVDRNEDGHTIINRLQPPSGISKSEWELASGGRNMSQLWIDGDIPGAMRSAFI